MPSALGISRKGILFGDVTSLMYIVQGILFFLIKICTNCDFKLLADELLVYEDR